MTNRDILKTLELHYQTLKLAEASARDSARELQSKVEETGEAIRILKSEIIAQSA